MVLVEKSRREAAGAVVLEQGLEIVALALQLVPQEGHHESPHDVPAELPAGVVILPRAPA